MDSPTPTPAEPAVDLSALPYTYTLPDGTIGGVGSSKPETIPGTPEFDVTKTDDLRTANSFVFDSLSNFKIYKTGYESSANLAVFGSTVAPNKQEDRDNAAWKIIKYDRPASQHNAGIVYDRISKYADQLKQAERAAGTAFPKVFGLDSDEELVNFVSDPKNNIPADIAKELVKETVDKGYFEERRRYGVDLKGKIQRRLLSLDDRYQAGQLVAQGGKEYLDGLTEQAKIAAWRDYAYFKDHQRDVNFANDAIIGGLSFVRDGATAIKGSVDALLPTAPDEYLSPAYRKDPAKRALAEKTVRNAIAVLQRPINDLSDAQASGNGGRFATTFDHYTDFDSPDNQEVIKALTELAALRADGAFAPGKTGEKLASFGAGVIESIPTFKHFISDSLDPGSVLFLGKHSIDRAGFIGAPFSPALTVISKFQNNTKFWDEARDEDVLSAISQFNNSWNNLHNQTDNAVASAFEAVGLKSAADAARVAYGDTRLKEAATATIDPITLGLGVGGLISKATGRTAMNMAKILEVSKAGRALTAEGEAIANEILVAAKDSNQKWRGSLDGFIRDFEKRTGRKLTEGEAIAVALSGDVDGAGLKFGVLDELHGVGGDKFKDLAQRVKDFQTRAAEHSANVAGLDKATRPVSGFFIEAFGTGSKTLGKGIRKTGEWMGGGNAERILGKRAFNFLVNNQSVPWLQGVVGTSAIAGGAYWTSAQGGEWYTGAAAGIFGLGVMLRPNVMMASGANLETFGRVTNRVGKAITSGERVSRSPLLSAKNTLRAELEATPKTGENMAKRAAMEQDLRMMDWMYESGWEDAVRSGFHVAVDDVAHGGTMGAAFAWANDRNTAGSGFGVGSAYSSSLRGLKRVTEFGSKTTAQDIKHKEIVGSIIGIDQGLDAHQSARLHAWLSEGKTWDEFIARADSYRRAYMATGGRIQLTNGTEMAAMSLVTHLSPDQVNKIRDEANLLHPDDPTAAANYAKQKLGDMDARNQARVNMDALERDLADSNRRLDAINGNITKVSQKIATEKAALAKNGLTESKKLVELQHELETQNTALKVTQGENIQIAAQHSEMKSKVENPIGFRLYEERPDVSGNGTIRQVKEGMYIHEGPNSHTIYFDVTKGDPFAMFHEAWEAVLHDDAVRPMTAEMTQAFWGKNGQGQRISDQARNMFYHVYSLNLSAPDKAVFDANLAAAEKHYRDTGSSFLLDRYTREAMAWWMATIDTQGRPAGYGGVDVPKVNLGVQGKNIIDTVMRLSRGDRRVMDILSNDNIRAEVNSLLDPDIGIIPRKYAAALATHLSNAGMRWTVVGDGTIRGFWTNNRNEVVRDPVVSKMYESILRMTGGKGSPRLKDLSITQLNHQQQAQLFLASGLSWLVDPSTGTPIPGVPAPGPSAAPTPPAPTGGTPTPPPTAPGPSTVIPTHNGQPVGGGAGTPTPTPTPTAGTPTPAPTPTTPVVPTHNGQPVVPPGTPVPPPLPPPTTTPPPTAGGKPTTPVPAPKPPVNPSRMPSLAEVSTSHSDMIIRALQSVPEQARGIRWSVDTETRGKPTIMWGQPTPHEIAAIEGLRGQLPDTIVDNLKTIMTGLTTTSGDRPVLTGRYVNVHSRRQSATTEARRMIGTEYQFISDRTFVPLHAETTTRYWSNDGNSVLSKAEYDALRPAEQGQYTPREGYVLKVFGVDKFNQNLSTARSEGIRIYDKEGNVTGYVKDMAGNEITAKRFNELFFDDNEFHTLANMWLGRYLEGGPIDPTSVKTPGGKITEPSARLLGNGDEALGEARLTALRATFGMTVRNGRVVVNPTNFTNQVTRGLQFPFYSMDPTMLGPLQDTGARSFMAQEAVTRGQFNMSPAAWDKISKERVAAMRGKGNLSAVWTHPNLPNTHIHEYGGKVYEIYVEGQEVVNTARSFEEAVAQSNEVRQRAEKEFEASQYAEKVLKEEAAARAKGEAKAAKDKAAAEQRRTQAEQDLLASVRKGNKSWYDAAESISNKEAEIIKAHEDAVARGEQLSREAQEKTKKELDDLQAERARINRELREDIIRRSAEAEVQRQKDEATRRRQLQEASDANQSQTARNDRERAEEARRLREDILAREAEKQAEAAAEKAKRDKEDQHALANALNSNAPELDLARVINASLRVDPAGLKTVALNAPLVVRRVGGGKPFVPRKAVEAQQVGSLVDATTGNTEAAGTLGSERVNAEVETVKTYFGRHMGLARDVQNAINSVWKTELGNQLVALHNGLNSRGQAVYTYHIYGVDGQEIYRTQDSRAAYNALQVNEERLRNAGRPQAKTGVSKEQVTAELYRVTSGKSIINQTATPVEREKMERTANRYK